MNYKYKFGMRALKTVFAVFVTMFICLIFNRKDYLFALIAACITIGNTVSDSFDDAKNRIIGTIFGASVGLFYFLINLNNHYGKIITPFILSVNILFIIYLCNVFNIGKIIPMSCVVFFSISLNENIEGSLIYAINRIIDTSIGIIVAILINILIYPPNNIKQIRKDSYELFYKSQEFMKKIKLDISLPKEDFDDLENLYKNIMHTMLIEQNEIKISNKNNICELHIFKRNYLYRDLIESFRDIYKIKSEIDSINYLRNEETKFTKNKDYDSNFENQIEKLQIVLDYHKKRAEYDYIIIENFYKSIKNSTL